MLFLALAQTQFQFCPALVPVELQWHKGIALPFDSTGQTVNFMAVEQQFPGPPGLRVHVAGGRQQRGDMTAGQPGLAILNERIAFGQVGIAGTQAFDLPAFQAQAGPERVLDMEFMARLTVVRNCGGGAPGAILLG
jgi:hypothetical protein